MTKYEQWQALSATEAWTGPRQDRLPAWTKGADGKFCEITALRAVVDELSSSIASKGAQDVASVRLDRESMAVAFEAWAGNPPIDESTPDWLDAMKKDPDTFWSWQAFRQGVAFTLRTMLPLLHRTTTAPPSPFEAFVPSAPTSGLGHAVSTFLATYRSTYNTGKSGVRVNAPLKDAVADLALALDEHQRAQPTHMAH